VHSFRKSYGLQAAQNSTQAYHEHPEHRGGELWVVGEQIPQLFGVAQHELADWDLGEHILRQVEGHLVHSASHARRTETSAFTGKGDGVALLTLGAGESHEAVSQDAAPDVSRELLLYVAREGIVIREGVEGVEGG